MLNKIKFLQYCYSYNLWLLAVITLLLCTSRGYATVYQIPTNGNNIVGVLQRTTVMPNDNLHTIARKYDVGYDELTLANPLINPDKIYVGQTINIPSQYILPKPKIVPELIINLAEKRLYYYMSADQVFTAPIAIGRKGWETPVATAFIDRKVEDPYWKVPKVIQDYNAKLGKPTPTLIPPGENNPLGAHAITLTLPDYIIHGTNDATTIGKRISAGCIRMYPEDIAYLFDYIPTGTRVSIINQPYKLGHLNGDSFLEVHTNQMPQAILDKILNEHPNLAVDDKQLLNIIEQGRGIPQKI